MADDILRPVLDQAGVECRGIADGLGFPYFHLCIWTMAPPGLPLQVIVDGGPPGFREFDAARLDDMHAPVAKKALAVTMPFLLHDAAERGNPELQATLAHCARLGVAGGIVIPLHGPRSSHGMLLLMDRRPVGPLPVSRDPLLLQAHGSALRMLGQVVDDVARASAAERHRQLTTRQRQALSLAARGKVLKEIADSLVVHPSTVRYLLTQAIDKLGVATRTEAIVRAAACGDFVHNLVPGAWRESSVHIGLAAPAKA